MILLKFLICVNKKEDTAVSTEEIIWYWDFKTDLWFSKKYQINKDF